MKKILALVLTFTMVLSLAACGGKDDPKPSGSSGGNDTPPAASQQEPANASSEVKQPEESTSSGGGESADISTLAGLLSWAGLSEEDITTDSVGTPELTATMLRGGDITLGINTTDISAALDEWCKQLFDKTVAVSDDGRAYYYEGAEKKDFEYVFSLDETAFISYAGWTYDYKGKGVNIVITKAKSESHLVLAINQV